MHVAIVMKLAKPATTPRLDASMRNLANCPVCGSQQFRWAYSAPTTRGQDQRLWSVCECKGCGHKFMNPQPSWGDLEFYYNHAYEAYDPMHGSQAEDDREIEQAKRTGIFRHIPVPTDKRLLDVGCGAGWFLRISKKLGAIEQGVEPSEYAAKLAQKQDLRVFHGTLESYVKQAPAGALFDIITANHVMEHVPEPVETLRTMRRLLAPGGVAWIAVPNADYPICRALKGLWHSSDLPYHLMHFTPGSMAEAGHRAGLKVRRQTTESIPRNVAASLGQYLRYKWKLPRQLTQSLGLLEAASNWYAQRVDAEVSGEAILTEFVAD
jgi:2-polyprenyl-3-methyl-5-hydroxy-6-metoxy-1,4-benzoquinol methylase